MQPSLLEKAVKEDVTGVLKPVTAIAYATTSPTAFELAEIANNVNKSLGYKLFEDLYGPSLIRDFILVTEAVQLNMLNAT